MTIRRVTSNFNVAGIKFYAGEIVILNKTITIVAQDDEVDADELKLTHQKVKKIFYFSKEIKINKL